MADSTLPVPASAILASITTPEPPHAGSDVTTSVDVQSPSLDNNGSTVSRGSYHDPEETEATTVVGNDVDDCLSCDTTSTSNNEYQHVNKALSSRNTLTKGENEATGPVPKVVEALVVGMDSLTPGRTSTGIDKDLSASSIKPRQSLGSARHNQTRLIVRGVADNTKHNAKLTPQDLAFWNQLHGKHHLGHESRRVMRTVDELFNLSGPFTTALADLPPATHACTTEHESPPPWKDSSEESDATRQTRLHEHHGAIYRLMPRGRTIYFGIDEKSFSRGGFTEHVTAWLILAAIDVAWEFNRYDLGVAFAFRPGSRHNVFNIRYDPSLASGTLAQAFFPSDPWKKWHLGISRRGALSGGGYLYYMRQILAHEFMHILGLRHWDAGFNVKELRERSVLCPGTLDGTRDTIMNTGVHPGYLRFSQEDLWVIWRFYAAPHEAIWNDRPIIDVFI